MVPYANSISLSVSNSKAEYYIDFVQLSPSDTDDAVNSETVASVVMNRDTAALLYSLLQKTLAPVSE